MKTVTGKVLSTTPVSLSKAASILSNFVSAETGASHVISAYLRRASVSFSELTQLHKELKSSKHRKPKSEITLEGEEKIPTRSLEVNQPPSRLSEEKVSQEPSHEVKQKRKKKKDSGGEVKVKKEVKEELSQGNELSQKPSHEVKQIGNFDCKVKIEEEEEKLSHKKKKKKDKGKNGNFEENGEGKIGIEEELKEERKKRKSEEIEVEGKENNTEEWRRKKKKRKSEGDS